MLSALLLLAYFCVVTVYSSDDYWYSIFWNDGLRGYLELMDLHYQTMNGRVLVHIAAHLVLACGNWAFTLMCCGICLITPLAMARHVGLDRKAGLTAGVFFLIGLLLMPRKIQTQGMFWISASCNYLLPAALACLLAAALDGHKKWALIPAFLCGATTEQMGLTAVFVCAVFLLDAFRQRKGILLSLSSMAMSALGVLTIFLSPATSERAAKGVRLGSVQQLMQALRWAIADEVRLLTENPMPLLVMLAFLVLTGVLLRKKTGRRWPGWACCLGCIALTAGSFGTDEIRVAGYTAGFVVLAGMSAALIGYRDRTIGVLALAALASAAVMLVTNTVDARVMLPFIFLMLLCVCLLGSGMAAKGKHTGPCAVLCVLLAAICLVPAIKGYWHNYQVDLLNRRLAEEARVSGCMRYCTDYDRRYTWIKADHDPFFRIKYLESLGLPKHMGLIYFSREDENPHMLYIDGKPTNEGVWTDEQGKLLFPLRRIVESMGGIVDWQAGLTTIQYQQITYQLEDLDHRTGRITWTDAEGNAQEMMVTTYARFDHFKYCDMEFFTDIMGIPIIFDEARFCYTITP